VQGPVKVRVITLESALGVAAITNADNGERGTGAVWDFSPQLPDGGLASMQLSAPKTLTFRLSDLRGLRPGKDFETAVLTLDTRVLGKLLKKEEAKAGEEKLPATRDAGRGGRRASGAVVGRLRRAGGCPHWSDLERLSAGRNRKRKRARIRLPASLAASP